MTVSGLQKVATRVVRCHLFDLRRFSTEVSRRARRCDCSSPQVASDAASEFDTRLGCRARLLVKGGGGSVGTSVCSSGDLALEQELTTRLQDNVGEKRTRRMPK